MLAASTSDNRLLRLISMAMWASPYFPDEVLVALCRCMQDPVEWVRDEAIRAVINREQADPQIIEILQNVCATDPEEKVRDMAERALRGFGIR